MESIFFALVFFLLGMFFDRIILRKHTVETRGGDKEFYELLDIMAKIYNAKNSDYAKSDPLGNFYRCEKGGVDAVSGIYTRITDKDSRVDSLMLKRNKGIEPSVKNEPLARTLLDKANYSLLMILALKRVDGFKINSLLDEIKK